MIVIQWARAILLLVHCVGTYNKIALTHRYGRELIRVTGQD